MDGKQKPVGKVEALARQLADAKMTLEYANRSLEKGRIMEVRMLVQQCQRVLSAAWIDDAAQELIDKGKLTGPLA
jgi:hypothetical protein